MNAHAMDNNVVDRDTQLIDGKEHTYLTWERPRSKHKTFPGGKD